MATEFLTNRSEVRRARKAWDAKTRHNNEKNGQRLAELRTLVVLASPTLQSLATSAGIPIEKLKPTRTPTIGLVRFRGIGRRRQLGPDSLQWDDLGIDLDTNSGKAVLKKICGEWIARIRQLVKFLKDSHAIKGLESTPASDVAQVCLMVNAKAAASAVTERLGDMKFESADWDELRLHLEKHFAGSTCVLCSAEISTEQHLCCECAASVVTWDGLLMLWDIVPDASCPEFAAWIELKKFACIMFEHQSFTRATLNELERSLVENSQRGETIDTRLVTVLEFVRREAAKKNQRLSDGIAPDCLEDQTSTTAGGNQDENDEIYKEPGESLKLRAVDGSLKAATVRKPKRRAAKRWLHEPGSEPPSDFYSEKWLAGSQKDLGFAMSLPDRQHISTRAAFARFVRAASQENSQIWCRGTEGRVIEVFFKSPKALHKAEECLAKYSASKEANGSERN